MFNVSKEIGEEAVEACYRTFIVTKPTTSYIANSIVGCIVNLVLFFVGTFLNALVIYVFWKTPRLRYKISYFMIMLLSSIDILVTLIVHPSHLVMSISEIIGKPSCVYKMFYQVAAVLLSGMSFLTFFVVNIERYVSIVHPIFHLVHVTKLRCLIVCSMFWALAVFGVIALLLNWNIHLLITGVASIVMLGNCYIYIAIFYIARKKKRLQQLEVRSRTEDSKSKFYIEDYGPSDSSLSDYTSVNTLVDKPFTVMDPSYINRHNRSNNMDKQKISERAEKEESSKCNKTVSFLHDLQLAKMCLLVVFTSFVLNLPNAIVLALQNKVKTVNGLVQSKIWTYTLIMMNSTVNCLIFFWANEKLRKEGWKVCKRLFKRRPEKTAPQRQSRE